MSLYLGIISYDINNNNNNNNYINNYILYLPKVILYSPTNIILSLSNYYFYDLQDKNLYYIDNNNNISLSIYGGFLINQNTIYLFKQGEIIYRGELIYRGEIMNTTTDISLYTITNSIIESQLLDINFEFTIINIGQYPDNTPLTQISILKEIPPVPETPLRQGIEPRTGLYQGIDPRTGIDPPPKIYPRPGIDIPPWIDLPPGIDLLPETDLLQERYTTVKAFFVSNITKLYINKIILEFNKAYNIKGKIIPPVLNFYYRYIDDSKFIYNDIENFDIQYGQKTYTLIYKDPKIINFTRQGQIVFYIAFFDITSVLSDTININIYAKINN